MPFYTYECETCGDVEVEQGITEDKLTACPECDGPAQRVITSTSFSLKGEGWFNSGGY